MDRLGELFNEMKWRGADLYREVTANDFQMPRGLELDRCLDEISELVRRVNYELMEDFKANVNLWSGIIR